MPLRATIHTKKFIIPPKGLYFTFCMGDCEGPCDQCRIATMASPPLDIDNIESPPKYVGVVTSPAAQMLLKIIWCTSEV
jgi:hypothetical protein